MNCSNVQGLRNRPWNLNVGLICSSGLFDYELMPLPFDSMHQFDSTTMRTG